MNTSYEKFKGWKTTAEENDVSDLNKDIDEANLGDAISFYYGSWKFRFGGNSVRAIMNIKEGKVVYYLYFGKVTASDNRYIESDSQLLVLYDKDVESLNKVLSTEVIDKFIKEQASQADLFD